MISNAIAAPNALLVNAENSSRQRRKLSTPNVGFALQMGTLITVTIQRLAKFCPPLLIDVDSSNQALSSFS